MTTTNFTFNVTRRGDISQPASVEYEVVQTNRFTALPADFAPDGFPSAVVSFAPNETSKTVTIAFDGVRDATEFAVNLKNPVGGEMVFRRASAIAFRDYTSSINNLFAPVLWLDANDPRTVEFFPDTNNEVKKWVDKSGNGNHPERNTISGSVSYNFNNLRIFSGSLPITQKQVFAGATSGSVFFVGNQSDLDTSWGVFGVESSNVESNHMPLDETVYDSFLSDNRYQINANFPTGLLPLSIINMDQTGTSLQIRRNAGAAVSTPATFRVPLATAIEQRIGGRFGFSLREVIMFRRVLSQTDREAIEGYLAHKWGLTASLPTTHPHKSTKPF